VLQFDLAEAAIRTQATYRGAIERGPIAAELIDHLASKGRYARRHSDGRLDCKPPRVGDLYVPNCLFAGHAFTLRSRVLSCFVDRPCRLRGNAAQRRSDFSNRRHTQGGSLFTWSRNRRRSMALHLRRLRTAGHQQGRSPPARRRPPVELPAMIGYIKRRRGPRAPQNRGPPVVLNPAQATIVASTSPPTRPREVA
jgi:hypothetical protein